MGLLLWDVLGILLQVLFEILLFKDQTRLCWLLILIACVYFLGVCYTADFGGLSSFFNSYESIILMLIIVVIIKYLINMISKRKESIYILKRIRQLSCLNLLSTHKNLTNLLTAFQSNNIIDISNKYLLIFR